MQQIVYTKFRSRTDIQGQLIKEDWAVFIKRLSTPVKTRESMQEYVKMDKADKLSLKDVGGFIGGTLVENKRQANHLLSRTLIVLDVDNAPQTFFEDFIFSNTRQCLIHSTHSSTKENPRYRIIYPLTNPVTGEKYMQICLQLIKEIGESYFDATTVSASRLMFWPSIPNNAKYEFVDLPGTTLNPNDFKNISGSDVRPSLRRPGRPIQKNPTEKDGAIGVFCQKYTIKEAITKFLNDIYLPTPLPDHYTYVKGSVPGGLWVVNDNFAYSFHNTDPAGGRLCNAFDLVRIHKQFDVPQMVRFCFEDPEIKSKVAAQEFNVQHGRDKDEPLEEWEKNLHRNKGGNIFPTDDNFAKIFDNDPNLKNNLRLNDWDGVIWIQHQIPRMPEGKFPRPIVNNDYAALKQYIGIRYGISSIDKIDNALSVTANLNHYNPLIDYLESLKWDGNSRMSTVFHDYLGAKDTKITREICEKWLLGAISRALSPGIKFDIVPILVGPQGCGKSTLINKLGQSWYSDNLTSFNTKDSLELLTSVWIMELSELVGLRKAEAETAKQFLTKQIDMFRPAYGRVVENRPRRCVFIGTTNKQDFLTDETGNRRYFPVEVAVEEPKFNVWEQLTPEIVGQIWAETYQQYLTHWVVDEQPQPVTTNVNLADEMEKAKYRYEEEFDELLPLIVAYLQTPLPLEWESMNTAQRRAYLKRPEEYVKEEPGKCLYKSATSYTEIWVECLGKEIGDTDFFKRSTTVAKSMRLLCRNHGWGRYIVPKLSNDRKKIPTRYGYAYRGWIRTDINKEDQYPVTYLTTVKQTNIDEE